MPEFNGEALELSYAPAVRAAGRIVHSFDLAVQLISCRDFTWSRDAGHIFAVSSFKLRPRRHNVRVLAPVIIDVRPGIGEELVESFGVAGRQIVVLRVWQDNRRRFVVAPSDSVAVLTVIGAPVFSDVLFPLLRLVLAVVLGLLRTFGMDDFTTFPDGHFTKSTGLHHVIISSFTFQIVGGSLIQDCFATDGRCCQQLSVSSAPHRLPPMRA